MKLLDLKGRIFGRLTVVSPVKSNEHGEMVWHCECSCGGYVKVTSRNLNRGDVRSCGCLYDDVRHSLGQRRYVRQLIRRGWVPS